MRELSLSKCKRIFFSLLLDASKPVRSHYTFTLSQNVKGGIQVGGAASTASFARASGAAKQKHGV